MTALSLAKSATRVLTTCLAEELGLRGIHVRSGVVTGRVAPGSHFDPDRIAEKFWRLRTQPEPHWETETVY